MNKTALYKNQYKLSSTKLNEKATNVIDLIQLGGDVASLGLSFVPGGNVVGAGIDALSAGIDLAQGQKGEAAFRGGAAAIGLIPGAGAAAKLAKAAEAGKGVAKAVTTAEKAIQTAQSVGGVVHASNVASKVATAGASKIAPISSKIGRKIAGEAGEKFPELFRAAKTGVEAGKELAVIPKAAEATKLGVEAGKQLTRYTKLAKIARTAGAGAVGYTIGKAIENSVKQSEPDEKKRLTPTGDRVGASTSSVPTGEFAPGEIADQYRGTPRDSRSRDVGERFRSQWLLPPTMTSWVRSPTVDARGKITESKQIQSKIKRAVLSYLKSKEGKELDNHLKNISKTLEH